MTTNNSGGIGIVGILGIVFVVLKLCGVITWSWWWVTAPFWGGLAALLAIWCIIVFFGSLWIIIQAFCGRIK